MWPPLSGSLRATATPAPAATATLILALALMASTLQLAVSAQATTSSSSSFAAHAHASIGSSTTTSTTSTTSSGGPQQQFSLFLSPHGTLGRQLAAEIDALAAQHPAGPAFPPHVTLLGLVEAEWADMERTAKQLARSMRRFRINFTGVQSGSSYWQCVFLKVAEEPDIMEAAAKARESYGVPQGPYMPHLSLKYGNLEEQQRAEIVRQETERLYGEGSETKLVDTGFEVRHVAVWYTPADDESCRAWRLVGEYKLGGDESEEGEDGS